MFQIVHALATVHYIFSGYEMSSAPPTILMIYMYYYEIHSSDFALCFATSTLFIRDKLDEDSHNASNGVELLPVRTIQPLHSGALLCKVNLGKGEDCTSGSLVLKIVSFV